MTDDGEGFPRLIPAERLFPGKDLSFLIVQDNGNVHHYLACFCRRSKITSRAWHRVDQSLRLLAHYLDPRSYDEKQSLALSIFS